MHLRSTVQQEETMFAATADFTDFQLKQNSTGLATSFRRR